MNFNNCSDVFHKHCSRKNFGFYFLTYMGSGSGFIFLKSLIRMRSTTDQTQMTTDLSLTLTPVYVSYGFSTWLNSKSKLTFWVSSPGRASSLAYKKTSMWSCWGSKYIEFGSGSRILAQFGSESVSGVMLSSSSRLSSRKRI